MHTTSSNVPQPSIGTVNSQRADAYSLTSAEFSALLEGLSQQDEAAARRFVALFLVPVKWQVARRLAGASLQDQEDMVWNTMIWLMHRGGERLTDYDPTRGTSARYWVMMKAKGQISNQQRAHERRQARNVVCDVEQLRSTWAMADGPFRSPLTTLEEKRFTQTFLEALHRRMTPTQRETFSALFIDELPYQEAAIYLGCTYVALRRRVTELRKLARALASSMGEAHAPPVRAVL